MRSFLPRLVALEARETPAVISGLAYQDANFNNAFDSGETVLSGVTLTLTVAGTPTSTTTKPDGTYIFTGVPNGTQTLKASLAGYSGTNASTVGVNVQNADTTYNFGFVQSAVLKGFVFTDLNGNSLLDALEHVVSGVTVNLDLGNNGTIDTTTSTDANGQFRFAGVGNGTHTITIDNRVTTIPGSRTVTVSTLNDVGSISFAIVPVGTLSGVAYTDTNANGIQDNGETGLAGASVKLDFYGDGSFDQTITTGSDGKYAFTGIPDGTHVINVSKTGYSNTTPMINTASFALGLQILPPIATPARKPGDPLLPNAAYNGTSFGLAPSRIIRGYLYVDANKNGSPDVGEAEVPGVTVGLDLDNNGSIDKTTTTDSHGNYAFTGLAAGNHRIVITPPAGFKSTALSKVITLGAADSTGNGFLLSAFSIAVSTSDPAINQVRILNETGTLVKTITPFAQVGETRIASGDVNGDGVLDYAFGTGAGVSAQVRVVDGLSGTELFNLFPFGGDFRGGVFVSLGDLNGDGRADLAMTPDITGGPRVRVFSGNGFTQIADFFGIDDVDFRGGARSAIGDMNNDGKGDLVVAAGYGGGPRVALYDGAQLASTGGPKFIGDFFAFEPDLRNGSFLAMGDVNGDGYSDMIVGAGLGGAPRVTVFSGKDIVNNVQTRLADFFAGGQFTDRTGVRLSVTDIDNDGKADIVAGYRPVVSIVPRVAVYAGKSVLGTSNPVATFDVVPFAGSLGGIYVG
ncbi:hypothetical protein BH11PLA2_BH11PLA2_18300 [soil metagenome]